MKKIIVALFICIICLTALASCSLFHSHEFGEWSTTKNPTCTEEGIRTRYCTCGEKQDESIPALGHTVVKDESIPSTCTAEGKTEGSHCSVCGAIIVEQEIVPVKEHTEVKDKAIAPTCTAEGKTEGSHCSVCGTIIVKQESVPKTAHKEVKDSAIAPTCSKEGKTEGSHCSVCGKIIVKQESIPKIAHKEVKDSAIAPTCTAEGKTEGSHCSVCGAIIVKQVSVPKKAHTTVVDKGVAATCTSDGKTEGSHCSVCGTIIKPQSTIKATGHTDTPICDHCGKNNRKELLNEIATEVYYAPKNLVRVYTATDGTIVALGLLNNNLVVLVTKGSVITALYLDNTNTIHYITQAEDYYIEGTSMYKSRFNNGITGMSFDKTNIPTSVSVGVELITNLKTIAAASLKIALYGMTMYFAQNGYPFTYGVLGYTSFS